MKIFGMDFYRKAIGGGLSAKNNWKVPPKNQKLLKELPYLTQFHSVFESTSLKPSVLILARPTASTGNLLAELKKTKTSYVYMNIDEFIYDGTVHVSKNSFLKYKNKKISLNNIKSAYVDFSELLEVYHFKRQNFTATEQIFMSRWIQMLTSLESLISHWIPCRPSELQFEVQNKWNDSLLAKKIGLKIPNMIVSNDMSEIKKFSKNQEVIYKETGIHFFTNSKKDLFYFQAGLLKKSKKSGNSYLKLTQKTPGLFQQYIEKKCDIRVFCIGNKIFSMKINSDPMENSEINWKGKEELLAYDTYKLAPQEKSLILKFRKELNWQALTLDFILGKDNKLYFLEANRPGQWLYMELLANLPITKEIARSLIAE